MNYKKKQKIEYTKNCIDLTDEQLLNKNSEDPVDVDAGRYITPQNNQEGIF